jgi:hypothetical protein
MNSRCIEAVDGLHKISDTAKRLVLFDVELMYPPLGLEPILRHNDEMFSSVIAFGEVTCFISCDSASRNMVFAHHR